MEENSAVQSPPYFSCSPLAHGNLNSVKVEEVKRYSCLQAHFLFQCQPFLLPRVACYD